MDGQRFDHTTAGNGTGIAMLHHGRHGRDEVLVARHPQDDRGGRPMPAIGEGPRVTDAIGATTSGVGHHPSSSEIADPATPTPPAHDRADHQRQPGATRPVVSPVGRARREGDPLPTDRNGDASHHVDALDRAGGTDAAGDEDAGTTPAMFPSGVQVQVRLAANGAATTAGAEVGGEVGGSTVTWELPPSVTEELAAAVPGAADGDLMLVGLLGVVLVPRASTTAAAPEPPAEPEPLGAPLSAVELAARRAGQSDDVPVPPPAPGAPRVPRPGPPSPAPRLAPPTLSGPPLAHHTTTAVASVPPPPPLNGASPPPPSPAWHDAWGRTS